MIELKLVFASFEEAADAMMKMAGVTIEGVSTTALAASSDAVRGDAANDAPRRRRTKVEMEAAKAAETTTEAAPEATEAPADPAPLTAEQAEQVKAPGAIVELTKEQVEEKFKGEVRPALGLVMQRHGQDYARAFLGGYKDLKLAKLSDLPAAEYDAFVAACKGEAEKAKAA